MREGESGGSVLSFIFVFCGEGRERENVKKVRRSCFMVEREREPEGERAKKTKQKTKN